MSRLIARLKGALLVAALLAAGLWYLSENPPVGAAVAAVVGVGLACLVAFRVVGSRFARRRLRTLGDLLSLSPAEFEESVAGLLSRAGWRRVTVVGGSADLGVDIEGFDRRGRSLVVQCKRHAPGVAVGSAVVQRFLGSITHAGADRGILVTTSRFSGPAIELAQQHGIELWDGEALVKLMQGGSVPGRV